MTTKHTPGPWEVDGIGQVIVPARPPAWRTLADVYSVHGDEDQADADARLIAAAPELLAALEDLLPYLEDCRMDAGARAAIAKAKGEKP